jgi:hypothetical protein
MRRIAGIPTSQRLVRIVLAGAVLATGTLAVLLWAPGAAMANGRGSTPDDDAESTYSRQPIDVLCRASTDVRCAHECRLHRRLAVIATVADVQQRARASSPKPGRCV